MMDTSNRQQFGEDCMDVNQRSAILNIFINYKKKKM